VGQAVDRSDSSVWDIAPGRQGQKIFSFSGNIGVYRERFGEPCRSIVRRTHPFPGEEKQTPGVFHIPKVLYKSRVPVVEAQDTGQGGIAVFSSREQEKRQQDQEKKRQGINLAQPLQTCTLLFLGNRFYGTDPGAGAAALTLDRIDPALAFFFGNSINRTLAVTGTAVYTSISNFIGHIAPLIN
jgi:hypothetical protein